MPRNYVKKKSKTYTPHDLDQAKEEVKNGETTYYAAAQKYHIPIATIYAHVNSEQTLRPTAGRPTVIPFEDEKKLAETLVVMEKWGFGLSRYEVLDIVSEYLRQNNIETLFKDNRPGPDWFINFKKRHRLSIKKAQSLEHARKQMTDPFVITAYFDLLRNTLNDLNISEKPDFIWNLDETSLCLDPSRTKVVGQINKPCTRATYGSGKENITVLAGASASGKKLPPLIVFKGKFVWDQWMADIDESKYDFELTYAASTKGWMETPIFYNYMEKVLIPSLGEERPVLIIYDGHSTHVDVKVVELAIRNNVTILKLPPHTSHLLQPLDIAVFKSFKTMWDAKLVEWQRRNIGIKMPKKIFSEMLAETWQETNSETIKKGFRKAGIYPFDDQVIPVEKYDPNAYKRYQKHLSEQHTHVEPNNINPRSLKDICIDFFNNQVRVTDEVSEKSTTTHVTTLSQLKRCDIQTIRFVANQPMDVPSCLRDPMPQKETETLRKIQITSNIIVKKATLPAQPLPQPALTFEELLLKKIQQDKKDINTNTKKKRVSKGAEVITSNLGKKILAEIETVKKTKPKTKKNKNKTAGLNKNEEQQKQPDTFIQNQEEQPGPSGIKKKRKRQSSLDSITSVSDIMSLHSDSDVTDWIDFEELLDGFDENPKSPIVKHDKKKMKCKSLVDSNTLVVKDANSVCTRSKHAEKGKGKENQGDLKPKDNNKNNNINDGDHGDAYKSISSNRIKGKSVGKKNNIKTNQIDNTPTDEEDKKIYISNETKSISANRIKGKGVGKKSNMKTNQIDKTPTDEENKNIYISNENKSDILNKDNKKHLDIKQNKLNVKIINDGLSVGSKSLEQTEDSQNLDDEWSYVVNDSVLVRYLIRNQWRYFIGFIEEISNEKDLCTVNFLKAVKLQKQLTFTKPKKKDIDKVPKALIVKKIDIQQRNDKNQYYLNNNSDITYFN